MPEFNPDFALGRIGTGGLLLGLLLLLAPAGGPVPGEAAPERLQASAGPTTPSGANYRTPSRPLPLHAAARRGRSGRVDDLLRRGRPPDPTNRFGATPLMVAARRGHREVARRLLEAGASTEARDHRGSTPLMYAASGGDPEILRILIESGARVEAASPSGATALFDAALGGHERSVRLLLEHGASPDRWDRFGGTPFSRALLANHEGLARHLLRRSDSPARQARSTPSLVHAARHGLGPMVRRLLELGASPDRVRWQGTPPLTAAAREHHTPIVQRLLTAGSSPDVRTEAPGQPGLTPLIAAVRITYQPFRLRGGEDIIRKLLRNGAALEAREDVGGMTALMYASQVNPSILELLLVEGADPHRKNHRGQSTLDLLRLNARPFPEALLEPFREDVG